MSTPRRTIALETWFLDSSLYLITVFTTILNNKHKNDFGKQPVITTVCT